MLSLYPILCSLIKGYAYFPFQLVTFENFKQ